ncbi:hypothetical protein TNCV_3388811 [Trichonephila clavipes]|nr:hypothetical protein TNCV_3388811 [Trichonephila clavipes]
MKHTSQREWLQHKHPYLIRDLNPAPTAPQSASLTTILDGQQAFDSISVSDFYRLLSIVGASRVTSKFNGDLDTDKCCWKELINLVLYCQIQYDQEISSNNEL